MGILKDRKTIEFRQLCALVRMVLEKDLFQSDSEWKAACREVIARWGWEEPSSHVLSSAMTRVEFAIFRGRQREVRL